MSRPIYVLGTGLSMDSSVCLLKDGQVEYAIEKERITRRKHDAGNDRLAMQYVLDRAGITLADVDLVVQNENFGCFERGNSHYGGEARLLGDEARVVSISHHLAHAYSALGTSPFEETAVLVIDGCGNAYDDCLDCGPGIDLCEVPSDLRHVHFEKVSYYSSEGGILAPVAKDFSPWGFSQKRLPLAPPTTLHSLGGVYMTFSHYIFHSHFDTGKLMGLAPYGRPDQFSDPIFELTDGRAMVCYETLAQFRDPTRDFQDLKKNFQYYADIAYWVQRELERALLYIVRDRYHRAPSPNLSYGGGVALNAVANTRILRETPFQNIYMQPAAGDNGLAIGCAYYGWLEVLGREAVRASGTTYFGAGYSDSDVLQAIDQFKDRVTARHLPDVEETTAALLAEGKVVGWYQGGAEFGPRALGHRSILAHPGLTGLRDHINANIKFREDFRPFAPSVLREEVSTYFDCDSDSPHMILVFPVRDEWASALSNVVHEDQSSRLHTVTAESEPRYFQLLQEFKKLTGLPILLNTSLNSRGMPIVETPFEAVSFFLTGALDAMVLGSYLIEKRPGAGPPKIRVQPETISLSDVPITGRRVKRSGSTYRSDSFSVPRSPGAWFVDVEGLEPQGRLELGPKSGPICFRLLQECDGTRNLKQVIEAVPELGAAESLLELANYLLQRGVLDIVDDKT